MTQQIKFLETDKTQMHRSTYNFASFSATPKMLENFLKEKCPNWPGVVYKADFRQGIAQSWPAVLDKETMIAEIGIDYEYDMYKAFSQLMEDIRKASESQSTK